MVRRIALAVLLLSPLLVGFTRPDLPTDSRAIYRFGGYTGSALKTLSGGLFSIAVGLRKQTVPFECRSHRDKAMALVDHVATSLRAYKPGDVEIGVSKIYVPTRELVLSVSVRDVSRLEQVRGDILAALRADPAVAFAGQPGKASVE